MASDWRRPRVGPDARGPDHTAAYPTLPSVAELLSSSRPHHHPAPPFAASTQPQLSLPHAVSASTISPSSSSSSAAPPATSWAQTNPASPPISPTDNRPARIYQEPQFRRQQPNKSAAPRDSSLTISSRQPAQDLHPQRPINETRQDSAIFYKPIETCSNPQSSSSSSSNFPYSHSSQQDSQLPHSPRPDSLHATATYYSPRPHSNSNPLAVHPPPDSSRSHGYFAERPPVDVRNGPDPIVKTPGSAPLPDHSNNTNTNNSGTNGTRNHRYNVRFAVNYTSDNMPSSQKARIDPPNPASVPSPPSEQQTASPEPTVVVTKEPSAPPATSPAALEDSQLPPRPRERENSVERCQGCNEPWRTPLPNLGDVRQSSPAKDNAQLGMIFHGFVERLRDEGKKIEAAHEVWRLRHSHCVKPPSDDHAVRPASPATSPARTEPLETSPHTRTEAVAHTEPIAERNPNKRKAEPSIGDEQQQMASKTRKIDAEAAPPVRSPAAT